jgi:hypothetical protein
MVARRGRRERGLPEGGRVTCTCVRTLEDGNMIIQAEPCVSCRFAAFKARERAARLAVSRRPYCRCCVGAPSMGLPEEKGFLR